MAPTWKHFFFSSTKAIEVDSSISFVAPVLVTCERPCHSKETRTFKPQLALQKISFPENCAIRGAIALVILPKPPDPTAELGLLKLSRLNTLKQSALNWSAFDSPMPKLRTHPSSTSK